MDKNLSGLWEDRGAWRAPVDEVAVRHNLATEQHSNIYLFNTLLCSYSPHRLCVGVWKVQIIYLYLTVSAGKLTHPKLENLNRVE